MYMYIYMLKHSEKVVSILRSTRDCKNLHIQNKYFAGSLSICANGYYTTINFST